MNQRQIIEKYDNSASVIRFKLANPLLLIFVGVPGSGKTTLAKYLEDRICAVRIASDDIKIALFDGKKYDINKIFLTQLKALRRASYYKVNLISDASSAKKIYRDALISEAIKARYNPVIIFCKISKKESTKRMKLRVGASFYSSREKMNNYFSELEAPKEAIIINTGRLTIGEAKKVLWNNIKKYVQ